MPTAEIWRVPRESGPEWVGPITVTIGGVPTLTGVKFAVLPVNVRPVSFNAPDADPQGSTGLGVLVQAVSGEAQFGIWAQVTTATELIVLEPADVGWVIRT